MKLSCFLKKYVFQWTYCPLFCVNCKLKNVDDYDNVDVHDYHEPRVIVHHLIDVKLYRKCHVLHVTCIVKRGLKCKMYRTCHVSMKMYCKCHVSNVKFMFHMENVSWAQCFTWAMYHKCHVSEVKCVVNIRFYMKMYNGKW